MKLDFRISEIIIQFIIHNTAAITFYYASLEFVRVCNENVQMDKIICHFIQQTSLKILEYFT